MSNIALVTDSTVNMPDELVQRYNITVVPLYVILGGKTYKDLVEIRPAEFYKRLAEVRAAGGDLPKTSQPTPPDFESVYSKLAHAGAKQIISVHVSAKMSGTLNSAQIAADMVAHDVKVHVVDSTTVSMQMGYMLIEAAEALQRGGSVQDALNVVEKVKENSCTYFTATDIEHLEASGRVGGADKVAEAEIKVRPVIGVQDGKAGVVSPERTQRAALDKVVELACKRLEGKKIKGVTVVHTDALDRAEAFKARVPAEMSYQGPIVVTDFGPVLAVHVGPGMVGLSAYGE